MHNVYCVLFILCFHFGNTNYNTILINVFFDYLFFPAYPEIKESKRLEVVEKTQASGWQYYQVVARVEEVFIDVQALSRYFCVCPCYLK